MGLATRIIPTLLCRGRQLVKGKQFNAWRSVGLVAQAVRIHQARGVDELVMLDIAATKEGRGPDLKLVEELTKDCFMPLAVGGGVRSIDDIQDLLRAGADKVVIKSAGLDLVRRASKIVGCQAIVAAMDYDDDVPPWQRTRIAQEWADAGAGEILLTRMDYEGMMHGYDLRTIYAVARDVDIPVIAHGGCGTYEHILRAVQAGASAVAAGAMFQFTDATPLGAAEYLATQGIETRIPHQ